MNETLLSRATDKELVLALGQRLQKEISSVDILEPSAERVSILDHDRLELAFTFYPNGSLKAAISH